jgi:hypothetical protein
MALLRCPPPRRVSRQGLRHPRLGQIVTLAAGLLAACPQSWAQSGSVSVQEYQVKAAFLYNFAKFVDWPPPAAGPKAPLVIVVFGRDPFGPALADTVWGKTINDRPLEVRHASRIEDLLPCHLLFISAQERRRVPEILKAVESAGVLTVSETDDFLDQGGAVRFVMEERRVRFGINLDAARRNGLTISSKLLSLAVAVKK